MTLEARITAAKAAFEQAVINAEHARRQTEHPGWYGTADPWVAVEQADRRREAAWTEYQRVQA